MRTLRNRIFILFLFLVALLVLPPSSSAGTNLIFIVDGSNSMWGQVDGVAKIETARLALTNLVNEISNETHVGLMSYGIFSKDSCDDVHLLVLPETNDRKKIIEFVNKLQPKGKTPIAKSLEMAGEQLRRFKGDDNHIVLISDGIESCGGEPCAVAAQLKQKGIDARVHVVGFGVGNEADKQLACIAGAGGGKYFQANSIEGFKEAIAEVNKEVQVVETLPEPKLTGLKEVFRDDFDGEDLAEHWEVQNPDPDSFIVENGELLIVNGSVGKREDLSFSNLFRLSKPLPKGDWVATVKLKASFAVNNEGVFLGVIDDQENGLYAWLGYNTNGPDNSWITIYGIKRSKGVEKSNNTQILNWLTADDLRQKSLKPYYLRISKTGRSYVVSIKHSDDDEANWTELKKFSILRQRGGLAIGSTQAKVGAESTILIDWVKIEVLE